MRLEPGMKAPDFTGETMGGEQLALEDLRGKTVLLKFYRFASCPICNLHVREYVKKADEMERAGITTVMVYHSPRELMESKIKTQVPFAMISDPGKQIFDEYGVEFTWKGMFTLRVWQRYMKAMLYGFVTRPIGHEGSMKGHPADFFIDPQGRVRYAHYGTDYTDSLTADEAVRIAQELGVAPPQGSPPAETHLTAHAPLQ